jgi:hypothetical protein
LIHKEIKSGNLKGIAVSSSFSLSHLLFIDDILIFCQGNMNYIEHLKTLLTTFCKATGMLINKEKSSLFIWGMSDLEQQHISHILDIHLPKPEAGFKYLGFFLKANGYVKKDWLWLVAKVEKKVNSRCNRWLSRADRLILLKSVLEAIPVYWITLSWVPKGILNKIRQLSFQFLWSGSKENKSLVSASWKKLAIPKDLGGWGLKNIFLFSKALAAKNVWSLIQGSGLWPRVLRAKYFPSKSVIDWIRNPNKHLQNGSMVWKADLNAVPLIGDKLLWKVRNRRNILISKNPWISSENNHLLPDPIIHTLNNQGFFFLNQIWYGNWLSWQEVGLRKEFAEIRITYISSLKNS